MDGFSCKVVLDSLAPCGKRLTTIEAKYPRFIHSEVLTHRDRARNSASSRAIPWEHKPDSKAKTKSMKDVILTEPVVPIRFGSEQKGMQAGDEVEYVEEARRIWLEARDNAVRSAQQLADLGVHKSLCNRITEPWMWITVVMTATEWTNFFRLRCHPDAEIHFQRIAGLIRDALDGSQPAPLRAGEWHLPYVCKGGPYAELQSEAGHGIETLKMVSAARCARVSYLTHDGVRDIRLDVELFKKLTTGSGFGHWSPMEHVAEAMAIAERSGPFIGWKQFRKEFANENA